MQDFTLWEVIFCFLYYIGEWNPTLSWRFANRWFFGTSTPAVPSPASSGFSQAAYSLQTEGIISLHVNHTSNEFSVICLLCGSNLVLASRNAKLQSSYYHFTLDIFKHWGSSHRPVLFWLSALLSKPREAGQRCSEISEWVILLWSRLVYWLQVRTPANVLEGCCGKGLYAFRKQRYTWNQAKSCQKSVWRKFSFVK